MKTHQLIGLPREIVGRKVKNLLVSGKIPATVYGKHTKSFSITIAATDFMKTLREAGETGLVQLSVGEGIRPVLIHNIQRHPLTHAVMHVEFHEVNMKEKVKTNVPVEVVDDSPAVTEKKGVLLTLVSEVEVEALPSNLPERLTVSAAGLLEVDDEVKVAGLMVPAEVTVLTDQDVVVAKIAALVSKEAREEEAQQKAEEEAAATEGQATTGSIASNPDEVQEKKE